jgi:Protein of unknown function (DUF4238)
MMDNKDQHWIAISYLMGWADPNRPEHYEPFVHLFDRQGGDHRRRSPANIFSMPELYTIFRGAERDLSLERHFGRLERDFVRARKVIESDSQGGPDEIAAVYGFVAAMLARPPHRHGKVGDHYKAGIDWEGVFEVNRRTITRAQTTIVSDRADLFFCRAIFDVMAGLHPAAETPDV